MLSVHFREGYFDVVEELVVVYFPFAFTKAPSDATDKGVSAEKPFFFEVEGELLGCVAEVIADFLTAIRATITEIV